MTEVTDLIARLSLGNGRSGTRPPLATEKEGSRPACPLWRHPMTTYQERQRDAERIERLTGMTAVEFNAIRPKWAARRLLMLLEKAKREASRG